MRSNEPTGAAELVHSGTRMPKLSAWALLSEAAADVCPSAARRPTFWTIFPLLAQEILEILHQLF